VAEADELLPFSPSALPFLLHDGILCLLKDLTGTAVFCSPLQPPPMGVTLAMHKRSRKTGFLRDLLSTRWPDVEELGTRGRVKGPVKALQHKDPAVRQAAAEALGERGDPQGVEPLIAALADEWRAVRRAATQALVQLDAPSVEPLIAALETPEWRVRQAAAGALGQIAASQEQDTQENKALGEQTVGCLTFVALGDGEVRVRVAADQALGQIGARLRDNSLRKQVEEALLTSLKDESWAIRKAAGEGLVAFGRPAVEPLTAALGQDGWRVREGAATALGELGVELDDEPLREGLLSPLIEALKDEDHRVRQAAVRALGQVGARLESSQVRGRVAGVLAESLGDSLGQVREAAAGALGRIGDARAANALVPALEDPNENVRLAAVKALDRLAKTQGIHTGPSRA
jgi:HEAT repeat protein